MRSQWRLTAVVVSGLVAFTSVAPALAQKKPAAKPPAPAQMSEQQRKDAARTQYKEGERLFKLGNYAGAYDRYKAADDVLPIAATKYKMAVCLDKQNKIIEAVAAYQVFLNWAPAPDKFADAIADSKSRIETLKKTRGKVRFTIEPGSAPNIALQVDGGQLYGLPPDRTLTLPPGRHTIVTTATGFDPNATEIDLGFAETKELKLTLYKRGTAPPPPPPQAGPGGPPPPQQQGTTTTVVTVRPMNRIPSYVLFGVAGAGAIVGTIFGVRALSGKSDFETKGTPLYHSLESADQTTSSALLADVSFGIAAACAIAGTVLLFVPRPRAQTGEIEQLDKTAGPRGFFTPYVGPNGGGAAALITF